MLAQSAALQGNLYAFILHHIAGNLNFSIDYYLISILPHPSLILEETNGIHNGIIPKHTSE